MYDRILVAVDHSEIADRAVLAARDLATLSAAVQILAQAGVKAHGEVRNTLFGYAAAGIVDDAKQHEADIIVLGSRGRSDLAGLILGSTAHKVIHLADRPVLVIR